MGRLKNWFIGEYLAETDDVFTRSKIELIYNYTIAYFIIGFAFYVGVIIQEIWYHVYAISFAVVALGSLPFILKYTRNLKLASLWLIIQQIIVALASIFIQQGVPDLAGGFWLSLFVLLAFFMHGKKWGLFFTLLMILLPALIVPFSQTLDIPDSQKFHNTPDTIIVPFVLIVVVVWMFIKAQTTAEQEIQMQRKKLEESHLEIENKNKDITDSINYAKRIQHAVLPPEETIFRSIPLSFIFYKPKDIVSGDFFWFHEINSDEYILVCGDCTGHGVPGAFMTVIGSNLLNQTVIDNKIFQPSQILQELDRQINFTLKQEKDTTISVQDGMDLTLIKVNKAKKELVITSAKRPVVFIRNKELTEIKASKFSLGGMRTGEKIFQEKTIQYQEDDILYLFTDGYPDQFGGEKAKKFSTKRLKELFLKIHRLPVTDQRNKLAEETSIWQGNLEQIDDILVMGIKF